MYDFFKLKIHMEICKPDILDPQSICLPNQFTESWLLFSGGTGVWAQGFSPAH
jgi:hypothetical protein